MVLSDNDTKEFYDKYEYLKYILSGIKSAYKEGEEQAKIFVQQIDECQKVTKQIDKIIYDDNEL